MRQDLGSNDSEQFKKIYMSRHENVRYVDTKSANLFRRSAWPKLFIKYSNQPQSPQTELKLCFSFWFQCEKVSFLWFYVTSFSKI